MLGLSCVTGVCGFYCLFPRHRGYVPPPTPSLPVSTFTALLLPFTNSSAAPSPFLDTHILHSLLFRSCVLFYTLGLLFLPVTSIPLPLSSISSLYTSFCTPVWHEMPGGPFCAFSPWSVAGNPLWCQKGIDLGENVISKEQRVCQVFRIWATSSHEKFIKIWLLLNDRISVIFNWNIQFAQNEVLHLSCCVSCQIFFLLCNSRWTAPSAIFWHDSSLT